MLKVFIGSFSHLDNFILSLCTKNNNNNVAKQSARGDGWSCRAKRSPCIPLPMFVQIFHDRISLSKILTTLLSCSYAQGERKERFHLDGALVEVVDISSDKKAFRVLDAFGRSDIFSDSVSSDQSVSQWVTAIQQCIDVECLWLPYMQSLSDPLYIGSSS